MTFDQALLPVKEHLGDRLTDEQFAEFKIVLKNALLDLANTSVKHVSNEGVGAAMDCGYVVTDDCAESVFYYMMRAYLGE